MLRRLIGGFCLATTLTAAAAEPLRDATIADYDQWKLALQRDGVAQPVAISARPGFAVDLLRVAAEGEGSWISLAFDARGRLLIGREDKGVLRGALSADGRQLERLESIEDTLLECRGLLWAHDSLYVQANNSKGLYRLRDADGDDRFDDVRLLRKLEGGVGHGRNGLALGYDGRIYLALGNNVRVPDDVSPRSPYRNYGLDRMPPCAWNEFLFDSDVVPPAGFVASMEPDGQDFRLVAGGFRNPYGIAFNEAGDLFTYDADMEWDAGAPWYRPTCVMHVRPGGEYGWRQGTSVWPEDFEDSLPRVVDIGLGSPTGVKFGERSRFPEPYRRALFILDWAYGRIVAVHLTPQGSSYSGRAETFIKGKPLNVTDLAFGPDGAMYFTVGGRRTQSALYRVRWTGAASTTPPPAVDPAHEKLHGVVLRFTSALGEGGYAPLDDYWRWIADDDRGARFAARTSLELMPLEIWRARALTEADPLTAATALLALARVGRPEQRATLFARLNHLLSGPTTPLVRRTLLRAYQLAILRQGLPTDDAVVAQLRRAYPAADFAENRLLCELLVTLQEPQVVPRSLDLLDAARTQEEQFFYLFTLRAAEQGWTPALRERYLRWFPRAESFQGAHYLPRFLAFLRTDVLQRLTADERRDYAAWLRPTPTPSSSPTAAATTSRPLVRRWTTPELLAAWPAGAVDAARGRAVFQQAQCVDCHRFRGEGRPIGPDLAGVSGRFGRNDLIEHILSPSKVVDERYRLWVVETDDGRVVTGQFVGGDKERYFIAPSPLDPAQFVTVPRSAVVSRQSSPASLMPEGLLNAFTADEIAALIHYLASADGAP